MDTIRKNVTTLKQELKVLAKTIRTAKQERKTVHFTGERTMKSPYSWQSDATYACEEAEKMAYEFRHKHIAYCLLRGRTMEQIEQKVNDGNEPNHSYIKQLIEEYDWTPEEKKAFAERNAEKAMEVAV